MNVLTKFCDEDHELDVILLSFENDEKLCNKLGSLNLVPKRIDPQV